MAEYIVATHIKVPDEIGPGELLHQFGLAMDTNPKFHRINSVARGFEKPTNQLQLSAHEVWERMLRAFFNL